MAGRRAPYTRLAFRGDGESRGVTIGAPGVEGGTRSRMPTAEYANSNRTLAIALGGTCLTIFTFSLFFLYDRAVSGQFDPFVFRLTLIVIIVSMFQFIFAATYYYRLWEAISRSTTHWTKHLRWANAFFVLGVILLTAEPPLILFTARLIDVGLIATALWVLTMVFVGVTQRELV